MNYQLAFVLYKSSALGYKLESRAVELLSNKKPSLNSVSVYLHTLKDYSIESDEVLTSIFNKMNELSTIELEKRFLRKSKNVKTLEDVLENKQTKKVVNHYIDKRLNQCLDLIEKQNYPLHYVNKKRDELNELNLLLINKEPLQVKYNFIKDEDGINYQLTLTYKEKSIHLKDKSGEVILNEPGWVMIENKLFRTQDGMNGLRLSPFFKKDFIYIPNRNATEFFKKIILPTIGSHDVEHKGFEIKESNDTPFLLLKIDYHVLNEAYGLQAEFVYGKESFLLNNSVKRKSKLLIENDEIQIFQTVRDSDWEKNIISQLESFGCQRSGGAYLFPDLSKSASPVDSLIVAHDFIIQNQNALDELRIKVNNSFNSNGKTISIGTPTLVKTIEPIDFDWFDLNIKVEIKGFTIPFASFKDHILDQNQFYELPDETLMIIPSEWFSQYKEVFELSEVSGVKLRLKNLHKPLVVDAEDVDKIDNAGSEVKKWLTTSPLYINATLRPYQLDGVNWLIQLHENKHGGCLADDMGLGKTLQVISLLAYLKEKEKTPQALNLEPMKEVQLSLFDAEDDKLLPSLVVMPLSLLTNWENEIKKFTPQLSCLIYSGSSRFEDVDKFTSYDLILTTYQTLRIDIERFKNIVFHYLILDESQAIKNPNSDTFKAHLSLKSMYRIAMTGTPIENSLSDLWAQFHFLNKGILGTLKSFKKSFIQPIEQENEFVRDQLKKIISPLILRREKEVVAKDLPERSDFVFYSEMSHQQKKKYEEEKSKARNAILNLYEDEASNQGRNKIKILATLTKLRQIANHPKLVDVNYDGVSGKFDDVLDKVNNLQQKGHKILIFSQYVKHLELFQTFFDKENMSYSSLYGRHSKEKRKKEIKKFEDDTSTKLFLISLKAGGTGLNLVEADYIFILDPWWNPQIEEQAIARAHRIGQTKKVFTYRFISRNTLEEKIHQLQQNKRQLAKDILDENSSIPFSENDIGFLLE